jgi:hypothetical protein
LLDAYLRCLPLDFDGARIPDDVRARLEQHVARREEIKFEQLRTDAEMDLVPLVALSVAQEFHMAGAGVLAGSDDTWLKAATGIMSKMSLRQIGWFLPLNERAHQFVRIESMPNRPSQFGEEHEWLAVFAIGPAT